MSAVFASNNDARPAALSTQPRSLDNDCESLAPVRAFGGWKTAATRSAGPIDSGRATGAGAVTPLATAIWPFARTTGLAGLGGRRLRTVPPADGPIAGEADWRRSVCGRVPCRASLPKSECMTSHGITPDGLQFDAASTLSMLAAKPNAAAAANTLRRTFSMFSCGSLLSTGTKAR